MVNIKMFKTWNFYIHAGLFYYKNVTTRLFIIIKNSTCYPLISYLMSSKTILNFELSTFNSIFNKKFECG